MNTRPSTIRLAVLAATLAFLLAWSVHPTHAHGTEISYIVEDGMVTIDAYFDSGEPMANAQITAYAPDNPSEPYYQGVADEVGHITFAIDPSIAGSWDISVRTAGHGEMLNIPIEGASTSLIGGGGEGRSQSQTLVLAGLVMVGLGGVALYFTRGKRVHART